jgi:hypothetical protein
MSIRQWKRVRRTVALGLAALAVAAPSAGAVIPDRHGGSVGDAAATATGPLGARVRPDDGTGVRGTGIATTPVVTVAPNADGFDWRDAGIGFGAALAAVLALAGSARVVRQVRTAKPAAL